MITRGNRQEEQVLYSARTFRLLLDSLARPGKITRLDYPHFLDEPLSSYSEQPTTKIPLNLYALGALLTLLDREVSFLLSAHGRWLGHEDPLTQWLALRSGATVGKPETAAFAFFCEGSSNGLLIQLHPGTLLEPEISTTAIYCVEHLTTSHPTPDKRWLTLELQGPGIFQVCTLNIAGLDKTEISHILATRQHYPLGIDVFLIDAVGHCIGLPRTTRIQFPE
jgi:alpha-D-ribose 1-methylphosphonate 5-triphosphate synthase subunit PhnH